MSFYNSFEIVEKMNETKFSILDLSISKTPKAMEVFEKFYGKDMTTRNWNTIERVGKKIKAGH
jgi:N-acetyl-gamma-glutamylphosphate reductase